MNVAPVAERNYGRPILRMVLVLLAVFLVGLLTPSPAQAAPVVPSAADASAGGPIILGAPAAPLTQPNPALSSPVTLGSSHDSQNKLNPCDWGAFADASCSLVKDYVTLKYACTVGLVSGTGQCKEEFQELKDSAVDFIGVGVGIIQRQIIASINESAVNAAVFMSNWVLNDILLGDNTLTSPRLDPDNSALPNSVAAEAEGRLGSDWFVGQAALMRSIGLYLLAPLMMLVVMQAIIKGSIFFLLRSALIILPVAILGSVILVQFTDLMLAVADDMSAAIASGVLGDEEAFKEDLKASLSQMDSEGMGFFTLFWVLVFIAGAVAIMVELLIRETGIYLAAFFLPLAFMAMVWPATAKWARRLVEILLGLIFSKVFITAALTLGIAGMSGTVGREVVIPDGASDAEIEIIRNEQGTASAAGVSGILILAALAGAKIISIAPGLEGASAGRIVNTKNAWGKGQAVQAGVGMAYGKSDKALKRIRPKGSWGNK